MRLTYLENRRNSYNTHWTAELEEQLTLLWAEGYSASQIAAKLNGGKITRSAVIGKVHRLNLPARKPREPARPYLRKPYRRRANGVPKPPTPPSRPRPPDPPDPPQPQPGAPHMRRLGLFRLGPHHCRWPLGELLEPARLFCAADTEGEIYCPFHQRIARPTDGRRSEAKSPARYYYRDG